MEIVKESKKPYLRGINEKLAKKWLISGRMGI